MTTGEEGGFFDNESFMCNIVIINGICACNPSVTGELNIIKL